MAAWSSVLHGPRPLCLRRARLAAPRSSALPGAEARPPGPQPVPRVLERAASGGRAPIPLRVAGPSPGWEIDGYALQASLKIGTVRLINDFEAQGHRARVDTARVCPGASVQATRARLRRAVRTGPRAPGYWGRPLGGPHALHVPPYYTRTRTRASLGRAVRTAYRRTPGPPLGVINSVPWPCTPNP